MSMGMGRYALGLDYGTLSVRALFVDIDTGEERSAVVYQYPHGVMDQVLPDGTKLPQGFALAHPKDYLNGTIQVITQGMLLGGITGSQVVGIGVDATSSSLVAVNAQGIPLCLLDEFASHPHAYIKLWKHHGEVAIKMAERIGEVARERNEPWLSCYGGTINGESLVPKTLETLLCDPQLFESCYCFMELGDWIVWTLTGKEVRSKSMASCNSLYQQNSGFPSQAFFYELSPHATLLADKFRGEMIPLGEPAGGLTDEMSKRLGLQSGTPVSAAVIDCHASVMGLNAGRAGDLVMVLGTSGCYLMNSQTGIGIPGIYSVAYEAHMPGLYGYEGGQSCVGDGFQWFLDNCVPERIHSQSKAKGQSIYDYLQEKAELLPPGANGLLALDWFNGVRTPLFNFDLSGILFGLCLSTKPEEIYRALLEATCYGAKQIIDTYEQGGQQVKRILASGGIAVKNKLMMQIMADVLKKEIAVGGTDQSGAMGSAVLGALAAGKQVTGAANVGVLMARMCRSPQAVYRPNTAVTQTYGALYAQYKQLTRYFSADSDVLQTLRKLRMS